MATELQRLTMLLSRDRSSVLPGPSPVRRSHCAATLLIYEIAHTSYLSWEAPEPELVVSMFTEG